MKYIGIDYGTKRIGLAIGNDSEYMAFPREVVETNKKSMEYIADYIKKEQVDAIVMGESLDLDGNKNPLMQNIEKFVAEIGALTGLSVYYEPEYFSSHQAQHIQGKNDMLDASSASIILGSFLNKLKNKK